MNKALACHCRPKEEIGHEIGTVLALDFKKKDGASFMDRSVYGHLCTNHGSKWQLDGRYFDGVNGYVDCGNPDSLMITPNITVVARVKPTTTAGLQGIYMAHHSTCYENIGLYVWDGNLRIHKKRETDARESAGFATIKAGERTCAAIMIEGLNWRGYKNGSCTNEGTFIDLLQTPNDMVNVGRSIIGGIWKYVDGLLGKVSLYNFADYAPRILSQSIGG